MFYKTALLGAVAFGFTVSATAQTASIEETKLDTIIVNGSRLDQTMTEIGSSVSVITRDDLEELGVDFALDAIATAPGVTVNQNGAFGGNASVRIRGASNDQTLVLIDGVPVNDPTGTGGGYNFAYLDTDTIETAGWCWFTREMARASRARPSASLPVPSAGAIAWGSSSSSRANGLPVNDNSSTSSPINSNGTQWVKASLGTHRTRLATSPPPRQRSIVRKP